MTRKDELPAFRDPTTPIERERMPAVPAPAAAKQVDEFRSRSTETDPGESSEVFSSASPTVTTEPDAQTSNNVTSEQSETVETPSNPNNGSRSKRTRSHSSPTPTTSSDLEDAFTAVKSDTPKETQGEPGASLDPTEPRTARDATVADIQKVFAEFGLPERGEIYESRARASTGQTAARRINAISIGRLKKYLAVAAVLVFVSSLLAYWMLPSENESGDPEVTAQEADDLRLGFDAQTTVVEPNPAPEKGAGVEWQSAFQPGSEGRSSIPRGRGLASENFQPHSAASNPSRPDAMKTAEIDQPGSVKPSPTKREKAEGKKVTVDDLITDKKKITVDDLINDN